MRIWRILKKSLFMLSIGSARGILKIGFGWINETESVERKLIWIFN